MVTSLFIITKITRYYVTNLTLERTDTLCYYNSNEIRLNSIENNFLNINKKSVTTVMDFYF